jgi:hypothetical protein
MSRIYIKNVYSIEKRFKVGNKFESKACFCRKIKANNQADFGREYM